MSTCLVVFMTVWASSSAFSPLSQNALYEPAAEPASLLEKVKGIFALSESILPSKSVKVTALQTQPIESPPSTETTIRFADQAYIDEFTRLEKIYALQTADRNAWRVFHRQDATLLSEAASKSRSAPLEQAVTLRASDLPEVHFASDQPQPSLVPSPSAVDQFDQYQETLPDRLASRSNDIDAASSFDSQDLATAGVSQMPTNLTTNDSERGQQNISPSGDRNAIGLLELKTELPLKESWETGRY